MNTKMQILGSGLLYKIYILDFLQIGFSNVITKLEF